MNHGLSQETVDELRRVLAREPEVEKAILYGSRAKGTHRHGSDIDLALVGEHLTSATVGRIALALDDSSLPYRLDLSILHRIAHAALIDHIHRVGIPIYARAAVEAR